MAIFRKIEGFSNVTEPSGTEVQLEQVSCLPVASYKL